LGLLVFRFAGFALGGAADLTGRHLVSGHDLAFSEIEMARGGRLEAFARACRTIAWVRVETDCRLFSGKRASRFVLLGFGCGKENFPGL
jgi:hypothetical protein